MNNAYQTTPEILWTVFWCVVVVSIAATRIVYHRSRKSLWIDATPPVDGDDPCDCGEDTVMGCADRPTRHCGNFQQ